MVFRGFLAKWDEEYELAMSFYKQAANAGNTDGMIGVGEVYECGYGVENSSESTMLGYKNAIQWYQKAVESGNVDGWWYMGAAYVFMGNYTKAVECCEKCTECDSEIKDDALYAIASFFFIKAFIQQDYDKAIRLYKKAAENGSYNSMFMLGEIYRYDYSGGKNMDEAISWYLKGAEYNDVRSMKTLGYLFYIGDGIDKDYVKARAWFRKCAEQGDSEARLIIGDLHTDGV